VNFHFTCYLRYLHLKSFQFTVPTNQTYYHCKVMRAPTFDRKQHIYRVSESINFTHMIYPPICRSSSSLTYFHYLQIEPFITNIDLVHHLLLYRCPPNVTQPFEAECYTGKGEECMETVAVWGVGGGVSVLFLMWETTKFKPLFTSVNC